MKLPDDSVSSYLLGFCGGLNADAKVTEFEAGAFLEMLRREPAFLNAPLLDQHRDPLEKLLRRDILYRAHYAQVKEIVLAALGISKADLMADAPPLIFDFPDVGTVNFVGTNVVITGEFHMGRGNAEEIASELGAEVQQATNGQTDYVIVGDIPTPSWKFGKYGNKVMRALELRDSGSEIRIISEDCFCSAIPLPMLQQMLNSIPKLKVDGFVIVRGGPEMLKGPFSKK
jgi:hypothetical protein